MQEIDPLALVIEATTQELAAELLSINVTADRTDVFEWQAKYRDGSTLDEYGLDGTQHGWKRIDLPNLAALILIPQRDHLSTHVLELSGDARPIFFRRRRREVNIETGEQTSDTETITVLGMQWTVRGTNVASYTAFYHDGSVKVTNDPDSF